MEILSRGAEATIYFDKENKIITKVRDKKSYRLDILDNKLRLSRTRKEFKILKKLHSKNILVPIPIMLDEKNFSFTMELISGQQLKLVLNYDLLLKSFETIMNIHKLDIIHSDLTTLNFIVRDNSVFLLDFGLSFVSSDIENKAVDLNMFFNCIKNEHSSFYKFKSELIERYKKNISNGDKIIERLSKVELRGRNKNK